MKRIPTIRFDFETDQIVLLDQRYLPGRVEEYRINSVEACVSAIADMVVRGAPLIGVTAAWGMWLAGRQMILQERSVESWRQEMGRKAEELIAARPTAVNLSWGVQRQMNVVQLSTSPEEMVEKLYAEALSITEEDAATCRRIGEHGLGLIQEMVRRTGKDRLNVLTHCNAGRLACVEYGTATAPLYLAFDAGINLHIWVDETRPRLQGAKLTAFELGEAGIPHTVIADNAAGYLMSQGEVDIVIVGCDRMTRRGDACNKIGTYTKALAARDNDIPFYIALPSSTIDPSISDYHQIPIEERSGDEIRYIEGMRNGFPCTIDILPAMTPTLNVGFDVTPARLITGIITEKGIVTPDEIESTIEE